MFGQFVCISGAVKMEFGRGWGLSANSFLFGFAHLALCGRLSGEGSCISQRDDRLRPDRLVFEQLFLNQLCASTRDCDIRSRLDPFGGMS